MFNFQSLIGIFTFLKLCLPDTILELQVAEYVSEVHNFEILLIDVTFYLQYV